MDGVGLIQKTCKLAGLPRLTPDNVPGDDIDVWNSIKEDTTCIFQWESDSASRYLKQLFSDETIANIRAKNPNFSYMDLFSIGNGAIRPAGASYREQLAKGIYKDNGNDELNEFLAPTLGFLVFQEQIIEFLHGFCGYTMGQADTVRRHFAKKTGTEKDIPEIKAGFIKTMTEEHGISKEEAEKLIEDFLIVIEDASDYLFSLNHADAYSWIGYVCGYLRYHYPLEFLVAAVNVFETDADKTVAIINYANKIGIKIKPIKFRYSLAEYNIDKENNAIYKGIASIKYLNKKIAKELYELKSNKYENFFEVLDDIKNKTSVNSRQLEVLIELNFFSEFGNVKQLSLMSKIYDIYNKKFNYKKEEISPKVKEMITPFIIKETEKTITLNKDLKLELMQTMAHFHKVEEVKTSISELMQFELEHLGMVSLTIPELPQEYKAVLEIKGRFSSKFITLYTMCNGEKIKVKVKGQTLENNPFEKGAIIKVEKIQQMNKLRKENGKWIQLDEKESVLTNYRVLRK